MKNIFVLGIDDFDLKLLKTLNNTNEGEGYKFHKLFDISDINHESHTPVKDIYFEGLKILKNFNGKVDGIVGFWDFPVTTLLPLFRKVMHLKSPSFTSVLKCEHKYWSRLEQKKCIPDFIPKFCLIDPFVQNYKDQLKIEYPFWLKPIRAAASHLGFKIKNEKDFEFAINIIRKNIWQYTRDFDYLLQFASLPKSLKHVGGSFCIAESIISRGKQCTLEGFVFHGEVEIYGIVDSIREHKCHSSFQRFQYPSSIPQHIQVKMIEVTTTFLSFINYNNAPFNVEFFWDQSSNAIHLLEINATISRSHSPLFHYVDGVTNHKIMIDSSLGKFPQIPYRKGAYNVAAKFMLRVFEDGIVIKLPSLKEIKLLQKKYPSLIIHLNVYEGLRLSDLNGQDSYSFEIADIFLAAQSQKHLLESYDKIKNELNIIIQKDIDLELIYENKEFSYEKNSRFS